MGIKYTIYLLFAGVIMCFYSVYASSKVISGIIHLPNSFHIIGELIVEIEIQDVSIVDSKSTIIAKKTITNVYALPIEFNIVYDDAIINSGNIYSVAVKCIHIDNAGKILNTFITTQTYPVITNGHGVVVNINLTET